MEKCFVFFFQSGGGWYLAGGLLQALFGPFLTEVGPESPGGRLTAARRLTGRHGQSHVTKGFGPPFGLGRYT